MPFFLFSRRAAIGALAVLTLATACGDDETIAGGDEPAADTTTDLVGRTFWSTEVVVDGAAFDFVDGTRIQLRFGADEINADAGCNNLFASYTLDDDTIVALGAGSTEMGCDPALHAQDDLVIDFLLSQPTFALDGDTLTLTNPTGDTIALLDKEVADPDRRIDEHAWEVTGFFDELAAWSSAVAEPAVIDFRDGTLRGTSGCGPIPFMPTVDLSATEVRITGDVGDVQWCHDADAVTKDYAADLSAVLFGPGPLTFEIDGPSLRLTAPDGTGLTARAVE